VPHGEENFLGHYFDCRERPDARSRIPARRILSRRPTFGAQVRLLQTKGPGRRAESLIPALLVQDLHDQELLEECRARGVRRPVGSGKCAGIKGQGSRNLILDKPA